MGHYTNKQLGDINDVTVTSAATGEVLQWNGSAWVNVQPPDPYWTYLSTTSPTGTDSDIKALYQFDGGADSLTDRSANSNDLTKQAGNTDYIYYDDLVGLVFNASEYFTAAADASFQTAEALTIELIYTRYYSSATKVIISCGDDTDADEADNVLYRISVIGGHQGSFYFTSEHDDNVQDIKELGTGIQQQKISYVAFTRPVAGTTKKLYINGSYVAVTAADDKATGGADGILSIGAESDGGAAFIGNIFSVRITAAEMSDAQILAAYNQVRGI